MNELNPRIEHAVRIADADREAASRQPVCGAPTLIHHIGCWPLEAEDPQDAESVTDYNDRLNDWVADINATLERLSAFAAGDGAQPRFSLYKENDLFHVSDPLMEFVIRWNGLSITCLCEVSFDYATFSFFADLIRSDEPASSDLRATIARIQDPTLSRSDYHAIVQSVFNDFWRAMRKAMSGGDEGFGLFPGAPFVVQYGLLVQQNAASFTLEDHRSFVGRLIAESERRNLTASEILGGRAVFVAAVGKRESNASVKPSRWIIFARPDFNDYEHGRILADINNMATLRLVATKEFQLFRKAGTSIRIFGHEVDNASRVFNDILEEDKDIEDFADARVDLNKIRNYIVDGDKISGKAYIKLTKRIRSLQNRLCGIEAMMYEESAKFTGGLQFRVSRSRYYARLFRACLDGLKSGPINGFQSYQDFIRRTIDPILEYISDIGSRADGLRTRLRGLLEAIQSKTLVDLTKNIETLNQSISKQTRSGKRQEQILFFIAVFLVLSQLLHAVYWQHLENKPDSLISKTITRYEPVLEAFSIGVIAEAARYIDGAVRYIGRTPPATEAPAASDPPTAGITADGEAKPAKRENQEPRSSVFAYLSAFVISVIVLFLTTLAQLAWMMIHGAATLVLRAVRVLGKVTARQIRLLQARLRRDEQRLQRTAPG